MRSEKRTVGLDLRDHLCTSSSLITADDGAQDLNGVEDLEHVRDAELLPLRGDQDHVPALEEEIDTEVPFLQPAQMQLLGSGLAIGLFADQDRLIQIRLVGG